MLDKKQSFTAAVRSALPKIVFLLCLLQPLLDIAGFWQNRWNISNTVTMALRMVLLTGTFLLGFLLSSRRRAYYLTAGVLLVLTCGHAVACFTSASGYTAPFTDLLNLVRIFFLPLMTLSYITFLRQNERVLPAMLKGMAADVAVIAAVQLISVLTKTNPYTYAVDKVGILGWFLWTNSQSAVLAMLMPITVIWAMRRWEDKILPAAIAAVICEAALYVLAPRLAYACLIAGGVGVFVCTLLTDRKHRKQGIAVLLITVLFTAAFPLSFTHQRLAANQERANTAEQKIKAQNIVIPRDEEETEEGETTDENSENLTHGKRNRKRTIHLEEKTADKLEKLYRSQGFMWSMVERFGRDRVFQIYDYSLDPEILADTRKMKINFCTMAMEDAGTLSHLFGLNLADLIALRSGPQGEVFTDNYDVENDFHGVYFLTGWVGLGCMIAFLLYFGIRGLAAVIRRPKVCFHLPMCGFAMAYVFGLTHAFFTASVLRRNNASIYLAMVLAGLWYLSSKAWEEAHEN